MKKVLKKIGIVIVILVLVVVIALCVLKAVITGRFVPGNLLEHAPDRVIDVAVDPSDPLQKAVTGGVIQGKVTQTDGVQAYLGVPYAAPPIAELRWRPAQDLSPWEGVRECTVCGPNPIQGDNEIKPGEYGADTVPDPAVGYSEDCLYLNVWTNGTISEGMPVAFYIPGGAWVGGSNSVENYNGEYLASQGVVFVSVNYRLGLFGWLGADALAAEDPEGSTGNYGFTDLIKALEWVRDNIAQFGGDPENITLYGGSAGGNLIDLLMISPKSEGLFHRAVSMSYPIDLISPAWDKTFKTDLGNKLIPDGETLEKLRGMSYKELMGNSAAVSAYAFSGPTIDGVIIDMHYAEAIAEGRGKDIDYITGFNYNDSFPGTGDAQFVEMIGGVPEGAAEGDVLRAVYNAIASTRAKGAGQGKTWLLQFTHPTPGPETLGAVHGGDVQYMLHYFSEGRSDWLTDKDNAMEQLASQYFINFCRTGNPNGEGLPVWEQSTGYGRYFSMGEDSGMQTLDDKKRSIVETFFKNEKGYSFVE